jgi:hypothetical protein
MKGRSAAAVDTPQIEDRGGVAGFGGSLLPARAGLIGFGFAALQTRSTQARRFDGANPKPPGEHASARTQ